MRTADCNGLEVWIEWRPIPPVRGEGEGQVAQASWTLLKERPARFTLTDGRCVGTGTLEVDVDVLAVNEAGIGYRLGLKQANSHDWAGDLRAEVKTSDSKISGTVYLVPEERQEPIYFDLAGWSPVSEDELATAMASRLRPGTTDTAEACVSIQEIGLEDAEVATLLASLDDPPPQDIHGKPRSLDTPAMIDGNAGGAGGDDSPAEVECLAMVEVGNTGDQPKSPPVPLLSTGSRLEIAIQKGQYTKLPPTPPPEYAEKDIASGLYNGMSLLSFGENIDEWTPEKSGDKAWCSFMYEVTTEPPDEPNSEPFLIDEAQRLEFIAMFDKYALDIELDAQKKQKEDRRAVRRKLRLEDRERREETERQEQEAADLAEIAEARRIKKREAERKRRQLKRAREQLKSQPQANIPTITRLQDEDRSGIPKRQSGVLVLRPDSHADRKPVQTDRLRHLGFGKLDLINRDRGGAGPSRLHGGSGFDSTAEKVDSLERKSTSLNSSTGHSGRRDLGAANFRPHLALVPHDRDERTRAQSGLSAGSDHGDQRAMSSSRSVQPDTDHQSRETRKRNMAEPHQPDPKRIKRSRSTIDDTGRIVILRDDYDTPPPPRLQLKPGPQASSSRYGPSDSMRQSPRTAQIPTRKPNDSHISREATSSRHDQKPFAPQARTDSVRRADRTHRGSDSSTSRPAGSTGMRRTDRPADYGLRDGYAKRERVRQEDRDGHDNHPNRGFRERRTQFGTLSARDGHGRHSIQDQEHRERRERREKERRIEREQEQRWDREKERRERERRLEREEQQREQRENDRGEREEREEEEERERLRLEEEEELASGPMEEQVRAFWEREREREAKKAQVERQEQRRRARRFERVARRDDGGGAWGMRPPPPGRSVNERRPVDSKLRLGRTDPTLGRHQAVIDMTNLSD